MGLLGKNKRKAYLEGFVDGDLTGGGYSSSGEPLSEDWIFEEGGESSLGISSSFHHVSQALPQYNNAVVQNVTRAAQQDLNNLSRSVQAFVGTLEQNDLLHLLPKHLVEEPKKGIRGWFASKDERTLEDLMGDQKFLEKVADELEESGAYDKNVPQAVQAHRARNWVSQNLAVAKGIVNARQALDDLDRDPHFLTVGGRHETYGAQISIRQRNDAASGYAADTLGSIQDNGMGFGDGSGLHISGLVNRKYGVGDALKENPGDIRHANDQDYWDIVRKNEEKYGL